MATVKINKKKVTLSSSGKAWVCKINVSTYFPIPKFAIRDTKSGKMVQTYSNGEEVSVDCFIFDIEPSWYSKLEYDLNRMRDDFKLINL
jgi:hypothetical protein